MHSRPRAAVTRGSVTDAAGGWGVAGPSGLPWWLLRQSAAERGRFGSVGEPDLPSFARHRASTADAGRFGSVGESDLPPFGPGAGG